MPQGVSKLAVGAEVPSTPEAGGWLALLVVLVIVGATAIAHRRHVRRIEQRVGKRHERREQNTQANAELIARLFRRRIR